MRVGGWAKNHISFTKKNNKYTFQFPTSRFHLIQQTNKQINKCVNKYSGCVGCVCVCVGDVLGASLLRLIVQMDDLYRGVYLFCGEATSGDLLFPGVAEFFTLLHIPGTIFHPHTPNPQTDLFTGSLPVHIYPLPTHAYCYRHVYSCIYAINSRRVQALRTTNTPFLKSKV